MLPGAMIQCGRVLGLVSTCNKKAEVYFKNKPRPDQVLLSAS